MKISVSVIIPVYNGSRTIDRAINSVLAQTYPVHEIIVINDGSTDSIEDTLHKFYKKIKYIVLKNNSGASVARNIGIKESSGNWISFLDADDEWLPGKLEYQVQLIKNNPSLKWCIGNYIRLDSNNEKVKIHKKPKGYLCDNKNYIYPSEGFIIRNFFDADRKGYCCAHTNLVIIKKSVLRQTGLFDETLIRHQDWDLWWRIALRYPTVGYIHKPLAIRKLQYNDQLLMIKRVKAKRGDYLRKVYDKNLKEAIRISLRIDNSEILNSFIKFASNNLYKSILMMIFLGHIDMAIKTLLQFDEIFSTTRKFFLKIAIKTPCIHYLMRFGYYVSQKMGLATRTNIYWDYLRFIRKNNLAAKS